MSTTVEASAADLAVVVTFPPAQSQIVATALDYAGSGALDQTGIAVGSAGAPMVSTSGATIAPTETVLAVVNVNLPNEVYSSITPGAPYIDRVEENDTAFLDQAGEGAEMGATIAGVQQCTWTTEPDPTTDWDAVIATYR